MHTQRRHFIQVLGSGSIKNAEITANHKSTETLKSEAGSQGGISITPVLSLLISGARTEAMLGTSSVSSTWPSPSR